MKILIIEDDKKLAGLLSKKLQSNGYKVNVCNSGTEVLKKGLELNTDLIILDLMLGNERGEDLVMDLREKKIKIPILVLSSLSEVNTKTSLLQLGADDYLTKPFDSNELLARIEALSRRCLDESFNEEETHGDITFYWKQNKIVRGNKEIQLTKKQGKLCHLLVNHSGKTVTIEELLKKIWNVESGHHSNVIQSTIRRLRKKLDNGFSHKLIRNVHGIGYSIVFPTSEKKEQINK